MFDTYCELWDLAIEEVQSQKPDMPREMVKVTLRLMWSDGTLRNDEDQDFLTSFEQELEDAWSDLEECQKENELLKQQILEFNSAKKEG